MSHPTPPGPTPAEQIRTVLAGARRAHLSTVLTGGDGQPCVAPVNIAVDDAGEPYTYLSTLTDPSRGLAADHRAGLVVDSPVAADADLAGATSVLLVGEMHVVLRAVEERTLRDRFVEVHPYARYVRFCDFLCWRMEVERVRLVPGFGRPVWVSAPEVRAAAPDPLAVIAGATGRVS